MKNFEFYKDGLNECKKLSYICAFAEKHGCRNAGVMETGIGDFYLSVSLYKWLFSEHEILDKQEKEYLSAVIKPFRNRVSGIKKVHCEADSEEHIVIYYGKGFCYITLPDFDKGTMYKGMEDNKEYTLKELGL